VAHALHGNASPDASRRTDALRRVYGCPFGALKAEKERARGPRSQGGLSKLRIAAPKTGYLTDDGFIAIVLLY
jgi:hypothetical protein